GPERSGTCLRRPAEGDELRQAVALAALAERDARAERERYMPFAGRLLFAQALAEHRQGRHDRAIGLLQGEASRAPGPAPRLVLTLALHRNGKQAEARNTLPDAL